MPMPQRLLMHGTSCKAGDVEQGTAPVLPFFINYEEYKMKDISILFNFNENDFASYNINIGEQAYQVNHDSSSINLCVDNHSSMNLSYKPKRLTVNKIIIDFILELIKIPLKLIFELTSNNKWYYESHLYKFNCDVKVNTDNLNEFKLQIINPTLKNNNQNIIKPYLISSPEGEVIIDNYYYELCFDELKRKLLKYNFQLFWLVLILSVFIFFCVPIKIFAFIATGILLFFAVLSGLSIKKYMAIKKVVQFS